MCGVQWCRDGLDQTISNDTGKKILGGVMMRDFVQIVFVLTGHNTQMEIETGPSV